MSKPRDLSVVVAARNDDHGGGFLRRMQIFLNAYLEQSKRLRLAAELIVVEWNPPVDKPRLHQVLSLPDAHDFCVVRFIEVPRRFHTRYKYASKLPLYQMIGKNAGIRRANGKFILATNIDILFSDELIHFLSRRELKNRHLYRVDRYDVPDEVPLDGSIDAQLQYCRQNVIRVNRRDGTQNLLTNSFFPTYLGIETDSTRLHFNACGDFTLMSRDDWYALRGYPEFDMYSAHIDSLFLLTAYHAGIRQEVLRDPLRIYHIEHSSSMIAEKANKLARDLTSAGVPGIKLSQLEEWAAEMNRNGQPILFNGEDWGMVAKDLRETVLYAHDHNAPRELSFCSPHQSETTILSQCGCHKANVSGTFYRAGTVIDNRIAQFPSLSVIIVLESGPDVSERCLDSLLYQTLAKSEYEILIVMSKSGVNRKLEAKYRSENRFRFVEGNPRTLSHGRAIGVEQAKGHTVLFLRDDSIADENLLREHWVFHKKNPPYHDGVLALFDQANFAMLGKRDWNAALKLTDLMKYQLRNYEELSDGEALDWQAFKYDNLSCNKDFLIRYGNFDEMFETCGDLELGYRLFKHDLNLVYNSKARAYIEVPCTFDDFCEDAFSQGYYASVLLKKHMDPEVKAWCREENAGARIEKIGEYLTEVGERYHMNSNQPSSEYFDRVFEYHRSRGIMAARDRRTGIIQQILSNRSSEKTKSPGEMAILIVADRVPACGKGGQSHRLYRLVEALARCHRVILFARKMSEKGKDIALLRKLGIPVFYDMQQVRSRSLTKPVAFNHARGTRIDDLLIRLNFDAVYLEYPRLTRDYVHHIRTLSPQAVVIAGGSSPEWEGAEDVDLRWVDVLITTAKGEGQSLSALRASDKRFLTDGSGGRGFEKELGKIIQSLPAPSDERSEMFRILPNICVNGAWFKEVELTMVLLLAESSEASRFSFESVFRNSDRGSTGIIVAIHRTIDDEMRMRMEKECIPYFVYRDEQELNSFIEKSIRECQSDYFGITYSCSIFPPLWDKRILSCIKQDSEIGLIAPCTTQAFHESFYQFEKEAWHHYEKYRGSLQFPEAIESPCIIMRRALIKDSEYGNIEEMIAGLRREGFRIARAKDTLVWDLKPRVENRHETIKTGASSEEIISVIIPSHNARKSLTDCLGSLFEQDCVNSGQFEILVVDDGSEDGTIEALSQIEPACEFRYYRQPSEGRSAAMNRGIRESFGEFLVFVSPYARARRDLLSEHLKTHRDHAGEDIAVLGYISCADRQKNTPFMRFLSKDPNLPGPNGVVYDFTDVQPAQNVDHRRFYCANISLKRKTFDAIGLFDEGLNHGFQDLDFGIRFSYKRYDIVYNPHAIVHYDYQMTLEQFLNRQVLVGRQHGLISHIHPTVLDKDSVKGECLYKFFGKESLIEQTKRIVENLEKIPYDIQIKYKYPGTSLLEKCYSILANYYFGMGINEIIQDLEGPSWLNELIAKKGLRFDDITKVNKAYELIVAAFLNSGAGNWGDAIKLVKEAEKLAPWHPRVHWAMGSLHMDLGDYRSAETAFEKGLGKRGIHDSESVFPVEDDTLYYLWVAMACIPQGRYRKSARVLEELIAEQRPLSLQQGAFLHKCLSRCYRALGENRRALACEEESERLKEEKRILDSRVSGFEGSA